jgi:hypothetical protein
VRERAIPEATVARLPLYLRSLFEMTERGVHTVSSESLALAAGVNSAKVRKDLSYLGSYGTRGVGYDVEYLIYQISRELGLTQDWNVMIVGVGNLGHALANYKGFSARGFRTNRDTTGLSAPWPSSRRPRRRATRSRPCGCLVRSSRRGCGGTAEGGRPWLRGSRALSRKSPTSGPSKGCLPPDSRSL